MLLVLSAWISVVVGCFVVVAGQDRRAKVWFLLLCLSAAAVSAGLWVEVNLPRWAFVAARVNMTSGLVLASMGMLSARAMCRLKIDRIAVILIALASTSDAISVWITTSYFTGRLIYYPWGTYVEANKLFVITPAVMTSVAAYGIFALWRNYRSSHPLEQNRTKYLLLAYSFLFIAPLDFLPHFGINLFGGPLSGIAIPLFVGTFSYGMLRYRLFEFRAFVGRAAGWFLAALLMVVAYLLIAEGSARLGLASWEQYLAAAIGGFVAWLVVGRRLPDWAQRAVSNESDLEHRINVFGDELVALLDEELLISRLNALCVNEFGARAVDVVESPRASRYVARLALADGDIIEREVALRLGQPWPEELSDSEVVLPLVRDSSVIGLITLKGRSDGKMYTQTMLRALRRAANIFFVTLSNIRSALEIEKRHQLDRYLAPQIVESILAGHAQDVSSLKRILVTIFFSDLKDFTPRADSMNPDVLAEVLNEYLSSMAEVAFSFGGTVDKFIGDSVMVIFGAPLDCVPQLQVNQCVRMALAMHARTNVLNEAWIGKGLIESGLVSRMGVHTGEATVGSFGSRRRVDYTAIGRSVNLASRLEKQCTPGKLLVSADCWQYLDGGFRSKQRSAIAIKGFADPVDAYEIEPGVLDEVSLARAPSNRLAAP